MSLKVEFSRHFSINCVIWLLVITFMQVYNEKEQVKQREIENVQYKEKRNTRKCKVLAKFNIQEMRSLNKSLMLSGIKEVVLSG